MPRIKLQSGKTSVLEDFRALAQQIQVKSLEIWQEAIVQKKLLAGVKDDSQLANLKLQAQLQKTSRAFQTMSNMMKTNQEVMMSSIRNFR